MKKTSGSRRKVTTKTRTGTTGATTPTAGATKACKDCGSVKRPRPHPGPRCTTCHRQRRKDVSEARRLAYVAKQYNLTPERYKALTERYGGQCWQCRKRKGRQVDHDHKCCAGKTSCGRCVRGLLCGPCNKFLGLIGDSISILLNGVDYLKEYQRRAHEEGISCVPYCTCSRDVRL